MVSRHDADGGLPIIFVQTLILIILFPFATGEQMAERRDLPSSGCDGVKRAKIYQGDSFNGTQIGSNKVLVQSRRNRKSEFFKPCALRVAKFFVEWRIFLKRSAQSMIQLTL